MKIEFTEQQLKTLDQAIQQLPYYLAAPLIQHINAELQKAMKESQMKESIEPNSAISKNEAGDAVS